MIPREKSRKIWSKTFEISSDHRDFFGIFRKYPGFFCKFPGFGTFFSLGIFILRIRDFWSFGIFSEFRDFWSFGISSEFRDFHPRAFRKISRINTKSPGFFHGMGYPDKKPTLFKTYRKNHS